MKLHLRPNLALKQTLAPQLIQSLKMLQMPVLKLEQTIRHELEINPLLEEIEELTVEQEAPEREAEFEVAASTTESEDSTQNWDDYNSFDSEEGYKVSDSHEGKEDWIEGTASKQISLYDHLFEQLKLLRLSEDQQLIGEYIIGNISPEGYLSISTPEMASELSVETGKIEEVLQLIQRFDPIGVGSRDLRESLLIQLREKGLTDTLAWQIVDEHIHDLDKKSFLQLSRTLSTTPERVEAAMGIIRSLAPTPALGRFDPGATPVVPDLVVERVGEDFIVYHNDQYIPRLRINSVYRDLGRRNATANQDTKEYVKSKLEQARWLINAIEQRRQTMIRVMTAVVERQRDFFEKGEAFLKPLIMEEIAQVVEMNVATISRVSNGKYVQTPLGVFEIKYFFNAGISSAEGEDVSKSSVKRRLEEIIKSEAPERPLSDQEIFQLLNKEGIQLARRTVTKYREELKIPPARMRKRVTV
jgi:RNA polymerase sigma-54 factor